MIIFKNKKKFLILLVLVILFVFIFYKVSNIVRYGYDRQSKIIELTKSIIPKHYVGKIKDNIFIIPKLILISAIKYINASNPPDDAVSPATLTIPTGPDN